MALPVDFFPSDISDGLVSRMCGLISLPVFYRCISGNSFFREEKETFFGGPKLVKFTETGGGEYKTYKITKTFLYNLAIYANGTLLVGEPSKLRLTKLYEGFHKAMVREDLM